jgi:signal transduction histidine kinase
LKKVQVYQINRRFLLFLALAIVLSLPAARVYAQEKKRIDSLEKVLPKTNGRDRFETLYTLFREHLSVDKDKALAYAQESYEEGKKTGDSLIIVRALHARGYCLRLHNDYGSAMDDYLAGLAIARRNVALGPKYRDQLKYILNNITVIYNSLGVYDLALEYSLESLKVREEEGDPGDISTASNNIGVIYSGLGDKESALKYYEKAIKLKQDNGITYELNTTMLNLVEKLYELGRYDVAEEKIKQVSSTLDSAKAGEEYAFARLIMGKLMMARNKYKQSQIYLKEALVIYNKLQLTDLMTQSLLALAKLHIQQEQFEEAIRYLNESLNIGTRRQKLDAYELFAKIYNQKGDFKLATHYQDLYIKLNKEIFSSELITRISTIQTAFEQRKNIQTIAEKDQILELNKRSITQQRNLNILLVFVIVLTAAFIVLGYRNYLKIKSVNTALASAKRMIEVQNKLLDQQVQEKTKELVATNEELVKANGELDHFIYKTSHDIRGPLASLKGMVNLAKMDVQDDKAQGYLAKLDLTAEKLNMVLTRLLIVNRINHAELKPEPIDFEPIIQEILLLEVKKGVPEKVKVEFHVDPKIRVTSDREMVRIILENLIDNAIKFHNDSPRVDSFVDIRVAIENDHVVARVVDNGVGIAEANRSTIFQMFVRASERSETGGIGLYLAKIASEKLGGQISLNLTPEKYTEFIVHFPVNLLDVIERRKVELRKQDADRTQVLDTSPGAGAKK